MLRLLCVVVSLLCAADVFARSPGCLEGAFNDALNRGFSVLALNFQKEDTFLVTDLEGISKEIKLNSQKLYDGNAQKCTVIPDRANRVKCVEFRFEVFGKKYMVFAGVYKENGVYPRLYADFQKTRCLDGWEFEENKGKLCDRDVFQFVPKSRSCVNEEVFFIQAKIDIPHCANHIFQELHSKGLVGRVFFATRKHDDVESPHNNGNIQLIGWEQWTKDENQDLNKSKCKYLQKQHHFNAVECHLVKLLVYGKPYLVLYWVYNFLTTSKKVINHSPERMQCQAGMDFNPSRFFSCQEDAENGIFVVATLPTNECSASYPMIGVGAPRQ